jgi:hypothetical protein
VSVEITIFNTLKHLVADRVYPDIAPESVKRPYITFQQVGGRSVNFLSAELPEKRNSRFQLNVWADSRLEAVRIAKQVDDTLRRVKALQTTVLNEPVATLEPETKLYGTRQDFGFWFSSQ